MYMMTVSMSVYVCLEWLYFICHCLHLQLSSQGHLANCRPRMKKTHTISLLAHEYLEILNHNYFSQVYWGAVGVGENLCVAVQSDRLTGLKSLLSEGGHLSELSVC